MTIVTDRLKSLPYSAQSPVNGADKPILTTSSAAAARGVLMTPAVMILIANKPMPNKNKVLLVITASFFKGLKVHDATDSPV
jgi:hypothetical protein